MARNKINGYERLRAKIRLLENQLVEAKAQSHYLDVRYCPLTDKTTILHRQTGAVFEQVCFVNPAAPKQEG